MPLSYSYPGIYIQELPLSTHTITPAPTSITAFVGYTHPWKTAAFNTAIQLFSFSDYETYFGGLYTSGLVDSDVAQAVYAFFLNGGNNAYVVGLQPEVLVGNVSSGFSAVTSTTSPSRRRSSRTHPFPASECSSTRSNPTDIVPMTATVTNLRNSTGANPAVYDTFDLVITYGTRIEVYRSVNLTLPRDRPQPPRQADQQHLDARHGRAHHRHLLRLSLPVHRSRVARRLHYPSIFKPAPWSHIPRCPRASRSGFTGSFSPADFIPVFQANSSLDNVEIFNLLLVPGVTDNTVLSAALAFAERKRAFAIVDPPPQAPRFPIPGSPSLPPIDAWSARYPTSQNGALYFPYLKTTDPVSGLSDSASRPAATSPASTRRPKHARCVEGAGGHWRAGAHRNHRPGGQRRDERHAAGRAQQISIRHQLPAQLLGSGTVVYGARTLVGDKHQRSRSRSMCRCGA